MDRFARSTSDLYRIVSALADKGAAFKVVDDPTIDTTSRTGELIPVRVISGRYGNVRFTPKKRTRSESASMSAKCLADLARG